MPPSAIVLRTAGVNCEAEMCRAFRDAGASPELVHADALAADPARLDRAELIGFPGGFSYGDDIAAGRVLAVLLRRTLYPALARAARRGVPMIGVCNGFQVLTQLGLLPGPEPGEDWPDAPPEPTVALAENESGRFVDRWCRVEADPASPCVWTAGFPTDAGRALLPVAHGEGRLVAADPELIPRLAARGRVPLRYAPGDNPNGSAHDVAGLCDRTGRILGLMPHPERALTPRHHPWADRLAHGPDEDPGRQPPGLAMFAAAVAAARADAPA